MLSEKPLFMLCIHQPVRRVHCVELTQYITKCSTCDSAVLARYQYHAVAVVSSAHTVKQYAIVLKAVHAPHLVFLKLMNGNEVPVGKKIIIIIIIIQKFITCT